MCTDKKSFRVVITGKGGVGKTTLTSCLATVLAQDGINVLAVDEDPQMNLPYALGLGVERAAEIVPLNLNSDYIEEKTGINPKKNSWGSMFKLNPDVDDVVERFGMKVSDNLNLLVMGTVKQAGGWLPVRGKRTPRLHDPSPGAAGKRGNPARHPGRRRTFRSVVLSRGFSHCLIVSDDTFNALNVACHSADLAKQIGIPNVLPGGKPGWRQDNRKTCPLRERDGETPFGTLRNAVPVTGRTTSGRAGTRSNENHGMPSKRLCSFRSGTGIEALYHSLQLFRPRGLRNGETLMKRIFVDYKKCLACKACETACRRPPSSLWNLHRFPGRPEDRDKCSRARHRTRGLPPLLPPLRHGGLPQRLPLGCTWPGRGDRRHPHRPDTLQGMRNVRNGLHVRRHLLQGHPPFPLWQGSRTQVRPLYRTHESRRHSRLCRGLPLGSAGVRRVRCCQNKTGRKVIENLPSR